jgi:hypothetical protein
LAEIIRFRMLMIGAGYEDDLEYQQIAERSSGAGRPRRDLTRKVHVKRLFD